MTCRGLGHSCGHDRPHDTGSEGFNLIERLVEIGAFESNENVPRSNAPEGMCVVGDFHGRSGERDTAPVRILSGRIETKTVGVNRDVDRLRITPCCTIRPVWRSYCELIPMVIELRTVLSLPRKLSFCPCE